MFAVIRRRLTPGTAIAILALVLAMAGGAYAAQKGVIITSIKQISPSVQKKLKGKQGPAGPQGAPGAQGSAGANGKDGTPGKEGPQGPEGKEGKAGKEGKEGSPWTAGGTLPSKKTETGSWAVGETITPQFNIDVPLSFFIPLVGPLDSSHVHYINKAGKEVPLLGEEVTSTACLGKASEPSAEPGNLCVYASRETSILISNASIFDPAPEGSDKSGASVAGAFMRIHRTEEEGQGYGTFAVTAP
jgi:Collagen triple helix repeat (20 copies)